jgi:hypothetical protein
LLFLLALALRMFYAFDAKVRNPIIGDVNQYVLYAWNLTHFGTFSSTLPTGNTPVVADNYRGPGYPVMLAGAMRLAGDARLGLQPEGDHYTLVAETTTWINYVYLMQALLGALSVVLTIAIARFWLSPPAALLAGTLVALWPHLVVFSAALLSETLFGFALLLALWQLCSAQRANSGPGMALSGLAFGATYLVNPLIALFPVLTALLLVWRKHARLSVIFVVAYLIAPVSWGMRNAGLDEQAHGAVERAAQNFVQGSWPEYLTAFNSRFSNEIARKIVDAEAEEETAFVANPRNGLAAMHERIALDPGYYLWWYIARKPFLLWDWNVRVGWGDIYFLATERSPYEQVPVLKVLRNSFAFLNPGFFACGALCVLALIVAVFRRRPIEFALGTVALLALYVTVVHVVLQAEPRYSIPYRAEEVLLAITTCAWISEKLRRFSADRTQRAEPGQSKLVQLRA